MYLAVSMNMIIFLTFQTTDYAFAQHAGNMTSRCSLDEECITVICIDDQPCETIISNSRNGSELREFLENKAKLNLIPRETVWYNLKHYVEQVGHERVKRNFLL